MLHEKPTARLTTNGVLFWRFLQSGANLPHTLQQDVVKTTGSAAKIALSADHATIASDGDDLSFVTVKITDAAGLMLPRAKQEIQFSVAGAGEIVATDNGNAIDLTSFGSHSRHAFNGMAPLIVRAKAAGLADAEIVLRAK